MVLVNPSTLWLPVNCPFTILYFPGKTNAYEIMRAYKCWEGFEMYDKLKLEDQPVNTFIDLNIEKYCRPIIAWSNNGTTRK